MKAATETSSFSSSDCSCVSSAVLVAAILEEYCVEDDWPVYCLISSAHCLQILMISERVRGRPRCP